MAEQSELSPEQQVLSEAMAIHQNDARNARLRALADSINETARMARTTLTLALLVALYLGVTLLSSTDLNLFLNGKVVLPQVGVGVSVVQSYIFAPPVFVFLHVQALFILGVLARKVSSFDKALADEGIKVERQEEYWNWLSAFAFVQVFHRDAAHSLASRLLTWLATNVIPLGLLFAIDVSFVRYQSYEITGLHHGLLLLDLFFIVRFNEQVFRGGRHIWKQGLNSGTMRKGIWQAMTGFATILLIIFANPPTFNLETSEDDGNRIRRSSTAPTTPPSNTNFSFAAALLEVMTGTRKFGERLAEGENPFDAGPCEWWGAGCRYLDVSGESLLEEPAERLFLLSTSDASEDKIRALRRENSTPLFAAHRNFRFADFDGVFAPRINLQGADLRGSVANPWPNFTDRADFTGANFQAASLDGADWDKALLDESVLIGTSAIEAKFSESSFQRAFSGCVTFDGLINANSHCTSFWGVVAEKANFKGAIFLAVDLRAKSFKYSDFRNALFGSSFLDMSVLSGGNFTGANFIGSYLRGASLQGANFKGANFARVSFQGADFENANIEAAIFNTANLQGAFGKPSNWSLASLHNVQFGFAPLADQLDGGTLAQRVEQDLFSSLLTDEMREQKVSWLDDFSVTDHVRERVLHGLEEGLFSGSTPESDDLVVYSTDAEMPAHQRPPEGWPAPPDTNDPAYWLAWVDWTEEFACENEHTARSSLQRWSAGAHDFVNTVRDALMGAREVREDCPGLQAIPEEEWKRFVEGR